MYLISRCDIIFLVTSITLVAAVIDDDDDGEVILMPGYVLSREFVSVRMQSSFHTRLQ